MVEADIVVAVEVGVGVKVEVGAARRSGHVLLFHKQRLAQSKLAPGLLFHERDRARHLIILVQAR